MVSALVEGNVFHRSRLIAKRSYSVHILGVHDVDNEFAILVSLRYPLSDFVTYSLATAIQFPFGLSATSRTGRVVLTSISSNLPSSSEYLLTVPSSEPVMKKPF